MKRLKRADFVARFGGKCQACGYSRCIRALQFHHRDPSEKAQWQKGRPNVSVAEIEAHPERFDLLCANCHFETHEALDRANGHYETCLRCGVRFRSAEHRRKKGHGKYCSTACHLGYRRVLAENTLHRRFWEKIEKDGDCWIWKGYAVKGVTPQLNVLRESGKYTPKSANQIALFVETGVWPRGKIYKTCNRPLCVNPAHFNIK